MAASLQGRVAIVTGGAGGIGAAVCRGLADLGARVAVADLDGGRAAAVAAGLPDAAGFACDMGDERQVVALVAAVQARWGRVDILNNNAALLTPAVAQADGDIAGMETALWDQTFAVNLRGAMIAARECLRLMADQRAGVIINTASNLALQGNVIQAAYSASKAGMIQMTRSIATSHGKRGIRCNAVLPGLTGTDAALSHLPQTLRDVVAEETLTPYLGAPEDIAAMVVFLCTDAARYITGQAIAVDGGTSAHIPGFARLSEFFGVGR
jgi:NAD(P)-dependent dehydrogenase (short-subunit alcohol dehydrogenase family)